MASIKGALCSTGAIITRHNGRNPRLIPILADRIECDGFEFMFFPSWYDMIDEITQLLRAARLNIPITHADKQIGELISRNNEGDIAEAVRRFDLNCRLAASIESNMLVLHLWGGAPSDKHIELNYAIYPLFEKMALSYGLELLVENVICAEKSPLYHMKRLMELYPAIRFTIDTKMAEFHCELPDTLECNRLWSGNVQHLHVNDYGGGYRDISDLRVLHIGEGHVDFNVFFEFIRNSDYCGYATNESTSVSTDGTVNFQKLNNSISAIRKALSINNSRT